MTSFNVVELTHNSSSRQNLKWPDLFLAFEGHKTSIYEKNWNFEKAQYLNSRLILIAFNLIFPTQTRKRQGKTHISRVIRIISQVFPSKPHFTLASHIFEFSLYHFEFLREIEFKNLAHRFFW